MCHLLKTVRNKLMSYAVEFTQVKEGNEHRRKMRASWKDIQQFYKDDCRDEKNTDLLQN